MAGLLMVFSTTLFVRVETATGAARTQDVAFRSAALRGTLHLEVYLPADYDTSNRRYPVVYFLHGLPAGPQDYQGLGFVERAIDRVGDEAILVLPQGARGGDSDPEYLDRGPGERWATAIGEELPHYVDTHYRTIAARRGRAIIGLSAGGYGAMHLAFRYLDDYSVVESWSGYFHPTDPTGLRGLDLGSPEANARADVHTQARRLRARLRREPLYIAFYVGNGDSRFVAENIQLNTELSQAGIPHVFRLYTGDHSQRLWGRYAQPWLTLALNHLSRDP